MPSFWLATTIGSLALGVTALRQKVTDLDEKATSALTPIATATIARAPEGKKRDNWNNPLNWEGGAIPSGNMSAVVAKGLAVTANKPTPEYSGELRLEADSRLRLAWASGDKGIVRAATGASRIVMESGSELKSNAFEDIAFPPITLEGDASVTMPSTGSHGKSYSFSTIEGTHQFRLVGCHRCTYQLNAPSTMSAFNMDATGDVALYAKSTGCFGTGDVSLTARQIFLEQSDTIASSATLSINTRRGRQVEIHIPAGVSQEVAGLEIDGVDVPAGVYKQGAGSLAAGLVLANEGELVVKH